MSQHVTQYPWYSMIFHNTRLYPHALKICWPTLRWNCPCHHVFRLGSAAFIPSGWSKRQAVPTRQVPFLAKLSQIRAPGRMGRPKGTQQHNKHGRPRHQENVKYIIETYGNIRMYINVVWNRLVIWCDEFYVRIYMYICIYVHVKCLSLSYVHVQIRRTCGVQTFSCGCRWSLIRAQLR